MNEELKQKDWVATGLTIMSAILVFRIVSGLVGIAWGFLTHIPMGLAMRIHSFEFVVVPAIGIAAAVLACRWHERKMEAARRKTKIGVFAIIAVLALFPIRIEIRREAILLPQPQTTEEEFQP